jgi:hypothetical protein
LKNIVLRGYAGCGKSWMMQYCILHAYSNGLFALPTAMMANRSVFLGTKHIDWLFCLPFEKNHSAYKTAETVIAYVMQKQERLNILRTLDILFIDEIGQVPAELLSVIDIILRRVRESQVVFGGVHIVGTMDHTQLQPVSGRPFLLSSLIITCFKMVKVETPVRCAGENVFSRLQELIRLHHSKYTSAILLELRNLLNDIPTYVDDWDSPQIGSDTYRLYGKKTPAIDATRNYINTTRNSMQPNLLREKQSVDMEMV